MCSCECTCKTAAVVLAEQYSVLSEGLTEILAGKTSNRNVYDDRMAADKLISHLDTLLDTIKSLTPTER